MLQILKSGKDGMLKELSLEALETGAWLNIIDPTPYEIRLVSEATNVEPDFLRSALDYEERSHIDYDEDALMVLTNIPVLREEGSYDSLPLSIVLTSDYIITVCMEETPILSEFNERNSRFFSTSMRARFLFQLLYKSATLYLRYLRQISDLSETIEEQLRDNMNNSDILRLLELSKGLTYFNVALRSNGVVLDRLLRLRSSIHANRVLIFYEEDEDLLEDVIIENKQAREMVEMYSQIMSRMADTFSSIISNNQNLVMKFLTSITIILAIPTVISSFFGMNIDFPPVITQPVSFLYIVFLSIVISIVAARILRKRDMF